MMKKINLLMIAIMMIICLYDVSAYNLTDKLIAYYNLNETSGDALDSLSLQNLALTGTVTYFPGQISNGRGNFSNNNGFWNTSVTALRWSETSPMIDATFSFWIYFHAQPTSRQGLFYVETASSTGLQFNIRYDDSNDNKFRFCKGRSGSGESCAVSNAITMNLSEWHMLTATYNRSNQNLTIYYDGSEIARATNTQVPAIVSSKIYIGSEANLGNYFTTGYIDEFGIWNKTLSSDEVSALYANQSAGLGYPFYEEPGAPSINYDYNVTLTKIPLDLNSSYTDLMSFNATIRADNEYVNMSNNSDAWTMLNFSITSSLWSSCNTYYGRSTCYNYNGVGKLYNMTKVNDTLYTYTFDDNDYYPAIYPFDYEFIDNTLGDNETVYLNHNIKFNIYNFSIDAGAYFIDVEFDAHNDSDNAMAIYYCNSSYSSGFPLLNSNCEVVSSFLPINISWHSHNFSRHYAVPIKPTIQKTQISYIIFASGGNVNNGWKFRYVENDSYDNSSFNYGSPLSWENTSHIYDIHIHEFKSSDYMTYFAEYYDGHGFSNKSVSENDWYNITNYAPTSPLFINPPEDTIFTIAESLNTSLYISWSNASDINNDSFTYYLYTYDEGIEDFLINLSETSTLFNWSTNANVTNPGTYRFYMITCDSFNHCSATLSDYSYEFCKSSWTPIEQPCIGGVKQYIYIDSNSCPESYDFPAENGTYMNCSYVQEINLITDDLENYSLRYALLIFLIIMFFTTLKYAVNSSGLFKLLYTFSGFTLIMISLLLYPVTELIVSDSLTIIVSRLFILSSLIIGIGLIALGIYEAFINDKG